MWRSENSLGALACLQVLEIDLRPLGKYCLYLLIHLGILIQKGTMHKEKQSFFENLYYNLEEKGKGEKAFVIEKESCL